MKVFQKQNVERRKNYPTLGHALILHQQIILRECEYHSSSFIFNDGNYCSIPPTLDGWVYIDPIHGPLDGPLYTWAQYTPTIRTFYKAVLLRYLSSHFSSRL